MRNVSFGLSICFLAMALAGGPLVAQSGVSVEGDVTASTFTGDGSNLTNVSLSGWQRGFFDFSCSAASVCAVTVNCALGRKVLSGGLELPGLTLTAKADISLDDTFPLSDSQWQVTATNFGASAVTYRAWAVCAPVSGAALAPVAVAGPSASAQAERPPQNVLLLCPEGDASLWVAATDDGSYFCGLHGLELQRFGGQSTPLEAE